MKKLLCDSFVKLCMIYCAVSIATLAHAQSYPSKPVRIVVPFPPGGGTDVIARLLAQKLTVALDRPFIVDNRGGAGGITAAEIVARAAADGHTLLMATAAHAMIATLYTKLNYDLVKDFAPVGLIASSPYVLVAHSSVPAKSVKELIALAKAKPKALNYGSAGNGTPPHLAAEMFKSMTGVEITHVAYKGTGPVLNGLASGEVQVAFSTVPAALPLVNAGKIRALATSSVQRTAVAPDLPTVAESVPGYEVTQWYGFLVPAGTPQSIISKLNAEILAALKSTEILERFKGVGADALGGSPHDFAQLIQREIVRWDKAIRDSGTRID